MTDSTDHTQATLTIRLLGPLRVTHNGVPLILGGMQARSVLAVLLLSPGRMVPSTEILQRAWRIPPDDTEAGRRRITDYVSDLRTALKPAHPLIQLVSDPPGYRADLSPDAVLDTREFTRLLEDGRASRGHDDDLAVNLLTRALGLWPEDGLALSDLDSGWLRHQAGLLQSRCLDAYHDLAEVHLKTRQPAQAAAVLREIAPAHPERQALSVLLVEALTADDEPVQATDTATSAITAVRNMGLEPSRALLTAQTNAANRRPPHRPGEQTGPGNQLPRDVTTFTGRDTELDHLLHLARTSTSPRTTVISAIDGMAGVGKTALAVRAGHRLTEHFPDGILFADLHGYTQGIAPTTPDALLYTFLKDLGIEPKQIPDDLDARAALYRRKLAGTRTLVLLDNANAEEQVRPLLPGAPGCLVLITSRKRLKGLDDTHILALDVLPMREAVDLLYEIAGPGKIRADDPLLEEIADLCGRLPLALRIAAALLRHRNAWTLSHLATKLRSIRPGLDGFTDGDRALSTVFDLSYTTLTPAQQNLYRRLSLHPGTDTDTYATTALLDTDPATTEQLLQNLVDHSLLTEPTTGRYQMHDLIRAHANTQAAMAEPETDRNAAQGRLLHYYAHNASAASQPIAHYPRPDTDGPTPAHAPALTDPDTARTWLRVEFPNLDAATTHAHTRHLHDHTIALAAAMAEILLTDGPWARARDIHQAAAGAATHLDKPAAHATALNDLGRVRYLTGEYPAALEALTQALEIYRRTGNHNGEANALIDLGRVRSLTGDYSAGADALTQALEIYRRIGNRNGEANALNYLGWLHYLTGEYPAALEALTRALEIYRRTGNHNGEANALIDLGRVRSQTGEYPAAVDALTQALKIFRRIGNHNGEANALKDLGRVRSLTGDFPAGADALTQALKIYRRIGHRIGEANALNELGRVQSLIGDYSAAVDALIQALKIFRRIGNHDGEANALTELGRMRFLTGDFPAAVGAQAQALEIYRRIGNRPNEAYALNHYAAAIAAIGERPRALAFYHQALVMNRELNKPDDEALSLEGIGDHHLATGDVVQGIAHLRQALEIYQRLGMRADSDRVQACLATLAPE